MNNQGLPLNRMWHRVLSSMFLVFFSAASYAQWQHGFTLSYASALQAYQTNQAEHALRIPTTAVVYQLAADQWSLSTQYGEGEAVRRQFTNFTQPLSQLTFTQKESAVYLNYSFERIWLSVGVNQTDNTYLYQANDNSEREFNTSDIRVRNSVIRVSHSWDMNQHQVMINGALNQQDSENEYRYAIIQASTIAGQGNQKEAGLSINAGFDYQYYYPLTEQSQLLLGAGLGVYKTLDGETYQQHRTQIRAAGNTFNSGPQDTSPASKTQGSNLNATMGWVANQGSIQLSVDKVNGQALKNAQWVFSTSVYF